ncbi:MAG: HPr kinase/phosphorylase, partial [Thermodesulfobacteriota bacterium]
HRLGVLILGKSGIGKSECAIDLINRGSKLISDDIVEIRKVGASKLVGNGPERVKHLMEVRGVGIINIKDLFGTTSVMDKREIDMVIELVHWDPDTEYDRLGMETSSYNILGVKLPHLVIPVSPGRNMATIIEVAARNQLLKMSGINTAHNFDN